MEGLLDLFECIIDSPRHGEYMQEFLSACAEHQALYKKKPRAVQPFIAFTNSKLNESSDRYEGLLLLKTFLPQCSDEQFSDNAVSWMLQCVRGIETSSVETNNAAFTVLKSLLQMSSCFQEFTKTVSQSVIAKFVERLKLSTSKPQVALSALQCSQVLIRKYGAPCTSHKAGIENVVLEYVDSKDVPLVSAASRCFALLPLLGGAGSQGAHLKTRWLEQERRACGTLQLLLDQLLYGVQEVGSFARDDNSEILPLESLNDMNPVVRIHQIANRFINVAKFLAAMLLNEFPVSKSVLPNLIINIVCRGLSVNCFTLGDKGSSDVLTVGSVLPTIHVALLRLLRSLIVCLGKNLYPHAKLICRLVIQTLKWTASSNHDHATTRPYGALRVEACRTLCAWLQVAKTGSCVESSADELVQALLQDVSSEKCAVKLNIQAGKKGKKRKQNTTAEETASTPQSANVRVSTRTKLADPTANDGPCQAALELLCCLVYSAGILVKPALHKLLQETVLLVLFELQRSPRCDLPVPYSKVDCRLALYKLLQALVLEPHPMWPPPTQFALHIFSRGQGDSSYQVSGFCTVAQSTVETLIHPSTPTLHFPASQEDMLKGLEQDPVEVTAREFVTELPDETDAMSVVSDHQSVGPRSSTPTLNIRGDLDDVPKFCRGSTMEGDTVPMTTDRNARPSGDVLSDPTAESETDSDEEEIDNEKITKPQSSQKNTTTSNEVTTSINGVQGLSDDNILGNKCTKKNKFREDIATNNSHDSTASETSTHNEFELVYRSKKELATQRSRRDREITDDNEAVDTTETTLIEGENIIKQKIGICKERPPALTKGKVYHGNFSGATSPKLLGGSEVTKITRFNLNPKFVNLSDDENDSTVNISSDDDDDDLHMSTVSVVSSNSNYQESILSKSGTLADDDLVEETDEVTLMTCKSLDNFSVISENLEETELEKDRTPPNNQEIELADVESEGSNQCLIIDLELPNGSSTLGPTGVREETSRTDGCSDEPLPKRLKTVVVGNEKAGNGAMNDTFEGMTDADVVKSVLDDFQAKLDN